MNTYPNLWNILLKHAKHYLFKPIITYGDEQLNYTDFCEKIEKTAACIQTSTQKKIVGINLSNPFESAITIIASLVAGKAFWVVNSTILDLLDDSLINVVYLINDKSYQKGLSENNSIHIQETIPSSSTFCWTTSSGSAAKPKISEHSYYSLMEDTYRQIKVNAITPDDRIDVLSSLSFSASLSSIFPAILSGASLHLKKPGKDISEILSFWKDEKITMTTLIPSLYRSILKLSDNLKSLPLRFVCLGGEKVLTTDFKQFKEKFGEKVLFQAALASSETRLIGEFRGNHKTPLPDNSELPYEPIEGKVIKILNDENLELASDQKGLIAIESKIIGSRYVTSDQSFHSLSNGNRLFISDDYGYLDEKGKLHLIETASRKTKYKGEFVDLDMIQNDILEHEQIMECYAKLDYSNTELHIYSYSTLCNEDLRAAIKNKLGALAFRSHNIEEEFPKLYSGKIDYYSLEKMIIAKEENYTTQNKNEQLLHGVWKEIFPSETQFNNKNFFTDLGGDSLSAVEFSIEASAAFRQNIEPNTIYLYPDFNKLLDYVSNIQPFEIKLISKVSDSAKNILIFPWLNGVYMKYDRFIQLLEGQYNFYVIKYPIEENNSLLSTTEIAKRCSEFLDKQEINFNLFLGYSYPGFLAYNTAAYYKKIENVILIDTPTYKRIPLPNRFYLETKRILRYLYRNFSNPEEIKRGFSLFNKIIHSSKQSASRLEDGSANPSYYHDVIHKAIENIPSIPVSDFNLGLITASDQSAFKFNIAPNYNWYKYNSKVAYRHIIKADHETILDDQNIENIVQVVQKHLDS